MEHESPRHTVILGSYNRPRMIQQAIRSVLHQTVQSFQLLITDDGSNDETLGVIRGLIRGDARCELSTVEHQDDAIPRPDGAQRAVRRINDAIPRVKGEIVHYLADDDWYDLRRFQTFDELFANSTIVVGYGRLVYVNPDGSPDGRTRYFEHVSDPCNVLDHNQVAHRRVVFDRIPQWNVTNDYSSDGQFFRAVSGLWPFRGIDRVVAYKRLHAFCMLATVERTTGRRE